MCHDHNSSEYVWTGPHGEADDEEDEETPSFLNEDADGETEILTDGGE
jgi:hypothetical protein